MIRYITILFASIFLVSCFKDVHSSLQKGSLQDGGIFEIKSMLSGCCGCKAYYYNFYENKKITEQFVVETNCGLYEPTKHIFKTDKNGHILSYQSYTAVTNDSFTIAVTSNEKFIFKNLDSIYQTNNEYHHREINFSKITGFKMGGAVHFPLGIKLPKGYILR